MSTTQAVFRGTTWLALAVALAPAAGGAAAQVTSNDSATIRGRVTSGGGAPVAGALVTVRRLRLATTTNDAGTYRLQVPSDRFVTGPETLYVNSIGYRPAAVPFTLGPGQVVVDVVLSAQALMLEQVVVTGTAGNQERRAQAAVVTSINASEVRARAPILTVNELLYAQAPGLSLTTASGTSGANTRIDIRGQSSVSLSNNPLVFIDGVRVTAGARNVAQVPGGATAGAGGQQLNALNDLNPDDIESIEVVKGPAAAMLYGSDASAGVIQILTKKGRAGARRFHQRLTVEYHNADPHFTPHSNYARCRAVDTVATSPNPLCRDRLVGTVVADNVLLRNDVFTNGWAGSLFYSADGGGDEYGYYGSFSGYNEEATTRGGELNHRSGRINFNWIPNPRWSADASLTLIRAADRLPQGDQSPYGYLIGGGFGSALTVRTDPDGRLAGGWFNNNLNVEAISAIETENVTLRTSPSVQLRFSPVPWLSNRLTLGADLVRTTATQMFPKNASNWYGPTLSSGAVALTEFSNTVYTVDYLGNINRRFGQEGWVSADLSFGSQWVHETNTAVGATGQGLLTNASNVISLATTRTASEQFGEEKTHGLFGQVQVGFHDRLYVQVAGRWDRSSAFGAEVGSYFLPKVGASYVVSEESFWQPLTSLISTLRLRTAYGTTGRMPGGTARLATYLGTNYITDAGALQPGVSPGNPGNPDLKPERGTEFEAGFDAGFFNDRAGLELTYFAKVSKDLLFPVPQAPSSGFSSNPLVNIGEVSNKGLEIAFRATPIDRGNVSWEAGLNVSTLANKIVSMGNVTPFVSNNQCFKPGVQIAAWCVPRVLRVDTVLGRAIVSDTAQLAGGQLPKYTMSFNTTLTLFRTVRLYAQLDGKVAYHVYNLARDFRDRAFANSAQANLPAGQGGYSTAERLRRLGPFFTESGTAVGAALVRDAYIEEGDFVRFRELSVTWTLPAPVTQALRAAGGSISVGGRNLALWTTYDGWDPEVMGTVEGLTPNLADVFTLPQTLRTFVRLNLQF